MMVRAVMFAAGLLALSAAAAAAAPPGQSKASDGDACFDLTQMQGDVPIDDHTVLFRVNVNEIYAIDFANKCPELTWPDPKLIIIPAGGMTYICHAIDLDIKVGQNGGPGDIAVPCIPTGLRRLTAVEVAALPRKDIP